MERSKVDEFFILRSNNLILKSKGVLRRKLGQRMLKQNNPPHATLLHLLFFPIHLRLLSSSALLHQMSNLATDVRYSARLLANLATCVFCHSSLLLFYSPLNFLHSTNNTKRKTGASRSHDPNSREVSSSLWLHTLNSTKDLDERVDSGNKHQNCGSRNNGLNPGVIAPNIVLKRLSEGSGNWVENILGRWANAGGWGEDERPGCETSDNGEWEERDVVIVVSGPNGWDPFEVNRQRNWQEGDVRRVENDAVNASSQDSGVSLNGEIGDDILVHDTAVGKAGGGVLWGEIAQEAEWEVGGEGVDGEGEERGGGRDVVELVEEQQEWAVGEEGERGEIVRVVWSVPSKAELKPGRSVSWEFSVVIDTGSSIELGANSHPPRDQRGDLPPLVKIPRHARKVWINEFGRLRVQQ